MFQCTRPQRANAVEIPGGGKSVWNTNTEWEEEESQHLGGIQMDMGEQANSFLANANTNSHEKFPYLFLTLSDGENDSLNKVKF